MELSNAICLDCDGRLYDKLKRTDELKIMFLGGSITAGYDGEKYIDKPYPRLVCDYLSEKFPQRKITCINLGASTFSSLMGLLEYSRNEALKPDIVFLEFAVNDTFDKFNAEYYECIIRKILKSSAAAVSLNCCRSDGFTCEPYMKELADKYGMPSISMKTALENRDFNGFSADGLHPNQSGHRLIAELAVEMLENAPDVSIKPFVQEACYGDKFEDVCFIDAADMAVDEISGFKACEVWERFKRGLRYDGSKTEDALIRFTVPAQRHSGMLTVVFIIGSDMKKRGRADIFINGKLVVTLDSYSIFGWNNPIGFGVMLEQGKDNIAEIRMHPSDEQKSFEIAGFGI